MTCEEDDVVIAKTTTFYEAIAIAFTIWHAECHR
jgi:hypothetical protein